VHPGLRAVALHWQLLSWANQNGCPTADQSEYAGLSANKLSDLTCRRAPAIEAYQIRSPADAPDSSIQRFD